MGGVSSLVSAAHVAGETPDAAEELRRLMGGGRFSLVILLVSRAADFLTVVADANAVFSGSRVVALLSDGEICGRYLDCSIVAFGFAAEHFAVEATLVDDVAGREGEAAAAAVRHLRSAAYSPNAMMPHRFCLTLGCGRRVFEDIFTSAVAATAEALPLIGGTVGRTGTHHDHALSLDGAVSPRGAVLMTFVTDCPVSLVCTDHLQPTAARLVITSADPARSVVHTINAVPAAAEFARIVGVAPDALSEEVFARHPLVFRMGNDHDVRTIAGVEEDGALAFCCRVETGMVLSLAEPGDMLGLLTRTLSGLTLPGVPEAVFVCDSTLRWAEARDSGFAADICELFQQYRVVGLRTDGERCGSAYMSQTIAGVAIYPPT